MASIALDPASVSSCRGARLAPDDRFVLPASGVSVIRVGRMPSDDPGHLTLRNDSKVSRFHCLFERDGSRWRLSDQMSSGGTLLNGSYVRERVLLEDGDKILVGDGLLRFHEGSQPAAAALAVARGDLAGALGLLLADWRRLPTARRGDWVEALGEAVAESEIAPDWARERAPLPGEVSGLLRGLWRWPPDLRVERLHAMARWPPDPRVARRVAALAAEPTRDEGLEEALSAALVAHATPADLPLLRVTLAADHPARAGLEARVARGEPSTGAFEEDFDVFAERFSVPADPLRDDLLAAVYADPEDDDTMSVFADYLQQRGDPRGTFAALQLLEAPTPDQREQIAVLLAAHQRTWLDPLADAVHVASVRWRKGFPADCALVPGAHGPLHAPAWRTIRTMRFERRRSRAEPDPPYALLAHNASAVAVREVHGLTAGALAVLWGCPPRDLRVASIDSARLPQGPGGGLPALAILRCEGTPQAPPVPAEIDPDHPLLRQLRCLEVALTRPEDMQAWLDHLQPTPLLALVVRCGDLRLHVTRDASGAWRAQATV